MRRIATAALLVFLAVTMTSLPSPAGAATRKDSGSAPSTSPSPCVHPSAKTSIPPVPPAQVPVVEKEVAAMVGKDYLSIGQCAHGLLFLMLTPGSEAMARRVRARFGPSVQIMVGFALWDGVDGRSETCPAVPSDAAPQPGIAATLELDTTTVTSGANFEGKVVFRNVGTTSVRVVTVEPIDVDLVRPGQHKVVGTYSGAVAGVGYSSVLAPGQTQAINIVGGTARCDGGTGSATPPGRYEAVGLVSGTGVTGAPPPGDTITNLVPVRVVRAR